MRCPLLALLLLLLPALAPAEAPLAKLHALLALIEQHNPELQAQRRLLAATEAAGQGDDAGVLALLRRQEQSWWQYFRVAARAGMQVSPGQDGSGMDTRAALEFSLPLGDVSGELAVAKERQRQRKAERTQAQAEAQQRLAYAQQRAALRQQALAGLAALQAAAIELAAAEQTLERRLERRPLLAKRVALGVEAQETLWALDDEMAGLEKQAGLLASQLSQQRMGLALLAGEAWERALAVLGEEKTTSP